MKRALDWTTLLAVFLILFSIALWGFGCSEDEGPVNGDGVDTDPPSVVNVTAIDNRHIEVEFDEEVDSRTSERLDNYAVVRQSSSPAPALPSDQGIEQPPLGAMTQNDTLFLAVAVLQQDSKSVLLTSWIPMMSADYDIYVSGVKDVSGNVMTSTQSRTFAGSALSDQTPPEIVFRSPSPDATGFGLSQSVEVQFSDGMYFSSVYLAFSWTRAGGSVPFAIDSEGPNMFIFTPLEPLNLNTLYTVGFAANTAKDWGNNDLPPTSWSFRTTTTPDQTSPTIVSTSPQAGATDVPLGSNFSITFSEPMDPTSFDEGGINVTPNPGDGVAAWQSGNRVITFDPDSPLLPGTVYSVLIIPGIATDLAGNPVAEATSVTFTTGSTLPTGAISGTISGDPNSSEASDPAGTIVVAFMVSIEDFDDHIGPPPTGGADVANAVGNYTILNLPDEVYYPLGILDSNGDELLDPAMGDAIGAYGVDFSVGDTIPDSVTVAGGGMVTGVDFPLIDPIAVMGRVSYGGTMYTDQLASFRYYVGLFDTATFDTTGGFPEPDFGGGDDWIVEDPDYVVSEFEGSLQPGTYYVGAFLDVNYNLDYDPSIDPGGMYMAGSVFGPVTVENGVDAFDIDIVLEDPDSGSPWQAAGKQAVLWKPKAGSNNRWAASKMRQLIKQALRQMEQDR